MRLRPKVVRQPICKTCIAWDVYRNFECATSPYNNCWVILTDTTCSATFISSVSWVLSPSCKQHGSACSYRIGRVCSMGMFQVNTQPL